MTSIPGSQFDATAPGQPLVVVVTKDPSTLPPTVPGAFNLEVLDYDPPVPDNGYQGLAVLGPGGTSITLVTGKFAIQDKATGGQVDTITALGDDETISAGPGNNDVLIAQGKGVVVIGGGQDTITLYGEQETVYGVGDDLITVLGSENYVEAGSGDDTIYVFSGNFHTVVGGSGNSLIDIFAPDSGVFGGSGHDTINLFGLGDGYIGGSGSDQINVFGSGNFIELGVGYDTVTLYAPGNIVLVTPQIGEDDEETSGNQLIIGYGGGEYIEDDGYGFDTIIAYGSNNTIFGSLGGGILSVTGSYDAVTGGGNDTVNLTGSFESFVAGDGNITDVVSVIGGFFTFIDAAGAPDVYHDTVIGFDQAVGDRISIEGTNTESYALANSTQVNSGQDTLITLDNGSTILLKGVSQFDSGFFG